MKTCIHLQQTQDSGQFPCKATSSDYVCILPKNHKGVHRACGAIGCSYYVWYSDDYYRAKATKRLLSAYTMLVNIDKDFLHHASYKWLRYALVELKRAIKSQTGKEPKY